MLRNLKSCRCGGPAMPKIVGRRDGAKMKGRTKRYMRFVTTYHECIRCGARLHTAKVYAAPMAAPIWLATYNRTSGLFDVTVGGIWIDEAPDFLTAERIGVDAVSRITGQGYSAREVAAERAESKAWDAQYHEETRLTYARALPAVIDGVQVDELLAA